MIGRGKRCLAADSGFLVRFKEGNDEVVAFMPRPENDASWPSRCQQPLSIARGERPAN